MRHTIASKLESFAQEFLPEFNPLSNATRLLLAGEFRKNDEDQHDSQRITQAARVAAVCEPVEALIETAYIKEERFIGSRQSSGSSVILHRDLPPVL
jgi:hypothetical protein